MRSSQESTNLRAYSQPQDVTAAEAIKTNKNVVLPAAAALQLVERKINVVLKRTTKEAISAWNIIIETRETLKSLPKTLLTCMQCVL